MLRINVRYYSALKRTLGRESEAVYVDEGATIGDLVTQVIGRFPEIEPYTRSLLVARNSEYSGRSDQLADGDTVDFMPPVSGG
jgi:MoaD family protein